MLKKILCLFLTFTIILSMFGCTKAETVEVSPEISLETVAKLNGCETDDLNVVYNDDGYLTFIAAKLSDTKIANEEEALTFIKENADELLELGDVNLTYYSSYTSPNTDIIYYRFQETLNGDFAGETDKALKYLVYGIKLGVDKEGYPVVISSDIDRSQTEFDTSTIISVDEAENLVTTYIPNINIYPDYTGYCFWNDGSSLTLNKSVSSKILAYMIYGDNPDYAYNNTVEPYMAYIVRAEACDDKTRPLVVGLQCEALGDCSKDIANTSLKFFDDMEDVGTYTYTINFDWMSDTDKEHAMATEGQDSMEVSVPVMYCATDGLYYLGEKEHLITVSNFYDFVGSGASLDSMNFYVSDNPDDLNSWHFEKADLTSYDANGEVTTMPYFDDPNYVVSSFAEYYTVVEAFGERFKMFESYPEESHMLCVYYCSGNYPSEVSDFTYNAANYGQTYDWSTFVTSPEAGYCLDAVVMCHEYSHGVNNHFADALYANEQGAVMESFADTVGYQMASLIDEKTNNWNVGGLYSNVLRNMADPATHSQPKYINGLYFVPNMDGYLTTDLYMDYGGVHENSGAPNYLCYSFVEGEKEEGEENLTIEEGLNLWFETLYVSNNATDFVDLGAYLEFAAKQLDYSDSKQALINRYIKELGFEDNQVDQTLLDAESTAKIICNMAYADGLNPNDYNIAYALLGKESTTFIYNKEATYLAAVPHTDMEYTMLYASAYDEEGNYYGAFGNLSDALLNEITINVKKIELNEGDTYTFPEDELVLVTNASQTVDTSLGNQMYFTKSSGTGDHVYNMYLVKVNANN